jgi:hypothetical protein
MKIGALKCRKRMRDRHGMKALNAVNDNAQSHEINQENLVRSADN